ncbi:hypothetical protein J4E89_006146 [Alternaria sp. Ai002NY15]|nr:hypothetical protein J4E89_006146 [Alternaria sp. Ai002NY15]
MDTTDSHQEEGAVEWTDYLGDVYIRVPCSNLADFLYTNRTLKNPASADFSLHTTGSNVAKGAAAGLRLDWSREGIKQDDADDWSEAAATMGDIYENAWITIAATGSGSKPCEITISRDFDWQAAKPPVGSDLELTILFLCEELGDSARVGQYFGGMVLKPVENDAFERVGFVHIYPDPSKYEYPLSEESSEEGAEAAKDDEDGEDDERMNEKNTAHKGAVYFSAFEPLLGAERVEADHVDSEDESSGSDGDDVVSSFVHALPVQTFRII